MKIIDQYNHNRDGRNVSSVVDYAYCYEVTGGREHVMVNKF
jgi:hypothetical protein